MINSDNIGKNMEKNQPAKNGIMAERVGFEPTRRCNRLLELQSSAFVHSATSP